MKLNIMGVISGQLCMECNGTGFVRYLNIGVYARHLSDGGTALVNPVMFRHCDCSVGLDYRRNQEKCDHGFKLTEPCTLC